MAMTERLRDDQIQGQYRDSMQAVASGLDKIFNGEATGAERETGFVLLVFPLGTADGARCNYISNGANRKDIAVLLREMSARFEGQPELSGRA